MMQSLRLCQCIFQSRAVVHSYQQFKGIYLPARQKFCRLLLPAAEVHTAYLD